ncbi:hypothetical protein ACFLWA_09930, partial [Chloroflexota bacterium]
NDHLNRPLQALAPIIPRPLISWARSFLPDAQIAIKDLIAEGDKIVVSFAISGPGEQTRVGKRAINPVAIP